MTKKTASPSFEETLTELDTIVNEMETGDLPLHEALEKFERGVALSRIGQKTLEDAEQKVKILLAEKNELGTFTDNEQV